ncbi:hypothetical protein C8T65DRAFT_566283, partial [Cerioporus squamosus]
MIKVAKKYGVRLDVVCPSDALRDALPIWNHFALHEGSRIAATKSIKCLRAGHDVINVGDAAKAAARLHSIGMREGHRPSVQCCCPECSRDKDLGCDNPHRCALAARKILDKLRPRWAVSRNNVADGLSLTPRRLRTNHESLERHGRVLFDPSILARLPIGAHFRVFGDTECCSMAVVRRPPRGASVMAEAVEVHTDGSCVQNGSDAALAGSGVWFGPGDLRNVAALVPGLAQTNQAAELYAVSLAVASVPPFAPLHIVTD